MNVIYINKISYILLSNLFAEILLNIHSQIYIKNNINCLKVSNVRFKKHSCKNQLFNTARKIILSLLKSIKINVFSILTSSPFE